MKAFVANPGLELVHCRTALNAIAAVVAAPPGIVTYADLDAPMPRGWVRS